MHIITVDEYLKLNKNNQIVVFSTKECGLCSQNKNLLKDYRLYYVESDNEEMLMQLGIKVVPTTIIFDNQNREFYKVYGVLYEKQIKEVISQYNKMIESQIFLEREDCGELDEMNYDKN